MRGSSFHQRLKKGARMPSSASFHGGPEHADEGVRAPERRESTVRFHSWFMIILGAFLWLFQDPPVIQAQSNEAVFISPTTVAVPGLPPCPVELFRQLLAKDRAEQEQLLADRPLEKRKLILAKVREYRALKPELREQRL